MGDPVNMVDSHGNVVSVSGDDVAGAILAGLRPESIDQSVSRVVGEAVGEKYSGASGKIAAAGAGILRGATLGGSDLILDALSGGDDPTLRNLRKANPYTSIGAEIIGGVAPMFVPGGQFTPAGALGKVGAGIARRGAAGGVGARAGYGAAGAALEGAGQAGGSYLSQVALEDKPLSAEAFVGAMGKGALFGAGIGGALGVSEAALLRAKSLFPRSQVSREAAETIDREAQSALRTAVDDGAAMQLTARQQIEKMRLEAAQVDFASRKQIGELNVQRAQSQLERQQAMTARAKSGRSRKVFEEPGAPPLDTGPPGPAQATAPGPAVADDLTPPPPAAEAQPLAAATPAPGHPRTEVVRVGKPSAGTYELRTWRPGSAEPEVRPVAKADLHKELDASMPDGFRGGIETHRGYSVEGGLPTRETLKDDAVYIVRPSEFAERGVMGNELKDANRDSVLQAWSEGTKLPPVRVKMRPDGTLWVEDGNHRIQAAARTDRPVAVEIKAVSEAWQPQAHAIDITGRIRSDLPAGPAADPLMAQLQGTKSALDRGSTLSELSHEADEALVRARPEAAKLVDAARKERMTREEIKDWIRGRKAEGDRNAAERGYRVGYETSFGGSKAPAGAPAKLDRVTTYTDDTAASAAARAKSEAKVAPEERLRALGEVDRIFGSGAQPIGEQIVEGAAGKAKTGGDDLADQIAAALRTHPGEHTDLSEELAEAARRIGAHEQASAELAEALGTSAPTAAADRAKAYRSATAQHADAAAAAGARAADDLASKVGPEVARQTGKGLTGSALERLGDVGAGLEVLKAMGISVPDVERIPVIGPVLGLYLKARAAMGVFRRAGGAIPKTAESVVASKAAATRNRVNAAVGQLLDAGAKGARKAQAVAGPAAGLAYRLFPGSAGKDDQKDDQVALYRRRMDELTRGAQPGAVMTAVRERVPTSDAVLQQEISAVLERKIAFLNSKAPREMMLPTLLKGDGEWRPSKVQLATFARYIAAAEDPAAVLEHVAAGQPVSMEAAETLRTVYPTLYREAQMTLVERAQDMRDKLPYARRVALSILFRVPVDGTMSASHIQFLQQGSPAAPPTPAQGSPAVGAPPTPTISGPVGIGDRTMTSLDRRAGA